MKTDRLLYELMRGRFGRYQTASYLSMFVCGAVILAGSLEMCTDMGHRGNAQRIKDLRNSPEDTPRKLGSRTPPKDEAHVAGAFYPDEHPEMFVEHPKTIGQSVVPFITAGLGGFAVFGIIGLGAFFVLGRVTEEPVAIDLDDDPRA